MTNPDHLALLYRISQTLSTSLEIDEVLARVLDEVIAALHAERAGVVLRNAEGQLVFRAARGLEHHTLQGPEFQISHSIVVQVVSRGKPLLTNDAYNDPALKERESVRNLVLRSVLCVPLQTANQAPFGAIYVDNRLKAGIFQPEHRDLLTAIAATAAIAIENAQLFQATRQSRDNLQLLVSFSAQLTATLDLETVFTECLEQVLTLLHASAASILTLEGEELLFRVAVGEKSAHVKPFRIPRGQGIAGWVMENRQGLIVHNARTDPRFYAITDAQTGFITEAILAAPLLLHNRAIGVIEVFNKQDNFTPADLALLTTIASPAAIAIENARLYELAVEKGRIERELQVAREVQVSLLPQAVPQLPGWEFAAAWQPAREVAGDFYDFLPHADTLGLVIADVTDKGMPAALFMALARSTLRGANLTAPTLAADLHHVNRLLCADSLNGMFVTLVYAALHPVTGAITYANAGHNPPLLYRAATGQLERLSRTGMALGIDPEVPFHQRTQQLDPGDLLLLYTDGAVDALNTQGEEFGLPRLEALLVAHAHSATALLQKLQSTLREFCANAAPFDDVTLVAVRRQ